ARVADAHGACRQSKKFRDGAGERAAVRGESARPGEPARGGPQGLPESRGRIREAAADRRFGAARTAHAVPAAGEGRRTERPDYNQRVTGPHCGSGGIGRRASLRSLLEQSSGGSSPPFRTNSKKGLNSQAFLHFSVAN